MTLPPSRRERVYPDDILFDHAKRYQRVPSKIRAIVEQELALLGSKLVRRIKRATPVDTGRLRRSTNFAVLALRGEGGFQGYSLYITQPALSNPAYDQPRYNYWYYITYGTQPQGLLPLHISDPSVLAGWVRRKGFIKPGEDEGEASIRLADIINTKGIKPNPYFFNTIEASRDLFQEASANIRRAIDYEVSRLPESETTNPNVIYNRYGGRER